MAWAESTRVDKAFHAVTVEASIAHTCLGAVSVVRASGINVAWVGGRTDIDVAGSWVVPSRSFARSFVRSETEVKAGVASTREVIADVFTG